MNNRFSMSLAELFSIKDAVKDNAVDAITTTFDFGYVRGYRAAMAEMKKENMIKAK